MANGSESVKAGRGIAGRPPLGEAREDEGDESGGAVADASGRPSAWERMLEELGGAGEAETTDAFDSLHASIAERLRTSVRAPGLERSREVAPGVRRRRRR